MYFVDYYMFGHLLTISPSQMALLLSFELYSPPILLLHITLIYMGVCFKAALETQPKPWLFMRVIQSNPQVNHFNRHLCVIICGLIFFLA